MKRIFGNSKGFGMGAIKFTTAGPELRKSGSPDVRKLVVFRREKTKKLRWASFGLSDFRTSRLFRLSDFRTFPSFYYLCALTAVCPFSLT